MIRIPLAILSGVLLFALLDRMFHLTEGAFHHLFGGGILWTYLLVPILVSFLVGYWIGPWGKFLAAIPPMTYILVAYLIASRHADYHSIGIPTAPFMMIFFITVPEVSFSGGWAGEVLRKKGISAGGEKLVCGNPCRRMRHRPLKGESSHDDRRK